MRPLAPCRGALRRKKLIESGNKWIGSHDPSIPSKEIA
jgi:hypothetical protein